MSLPLSWRQRWPHRYVRSITSLSRESLEEIERAAGEIGVLPGILLETVLRSDTSLLTRQQQARLEAWALNARAREVFERIFHAADIEEQILADLRDSDDDTPATMAEQTKEVAMQTLEELAEAIEQAMPADVYQREVRLPNGAILKLERSRRAGSYCKACGMPLDAHQRNCPDR